VPRVSIIIPTHNRADLAARAVESAQEAGKEVEIILVDDASTEPAARIAKSFKNVRYVRLERNQGVAGARNVGLMASTGKYIAFLDDDDIRLPGSLDVQIETLERNSQAGLVYSPVIAADQDGNPTGASYPRQCTEGDVFWQLLAMDLPILLQASVIRREVFSRIGLLDSHLRFIDDWDLAVRISEVYPIMAVKQPATLYREATPFSVQATSSPDLIWSRMARHQLRLLCLPRAMASQARERKDARTRLIQRACRSLIWSAATGLLEGARTYARKNIMVAMRLNPSLSARPGILRLFLRTLAPDRVEGKY
jgi:glycosyltransferase involved in cell wall biosynthesis